MYVFIIQCVLVTLLCMHCKTYSKDNNKENDILQCAILSEKVCAQLV